MFSTQPRKKYTTHCCPGKSPKKMAYSTSAQEEPYVEHVAGPNGPVIDSRIPCLNNVRVRGVKRVEADTRKIEGVFGQIYQRGVTVRSHTNA